MSIANVEFPKLAHGNLIEAMQTIGETRLQRLGMLVKRHNDSLSELNVAIGLVKTDSTLSQIRTGAPHSKTGKPREMGDVLARKIEMALGLERGWMDQPPTFAEAYGTDDPRAKVMELMEHMPTDQWNTAVRLLDALAQPAPKAANGS